MRDKRLEAIASLEDLGAGFTLATHDLEIRGAGELLGEGQSGQIQEIGFIAVHATCSTARSSALKAGKEPDLDLSQRARGRGRAGSAGADPGRLPARRAHAA